MIKDSQDWVENPFHFRLYPGSLSCNKKGVMAPVLMVEVEREHVNIGIDFFCNNFEGENPFSPCWLSYLFLTLYKNQLTDTERFHIIQDTNFHIGQVKLIHLFGLQDIDTTVALKQDIMIRLRKLLLGLCAHQTNQRLFVQIERDSNPEAIVCAYNSVDHDTVMSNIPHLSTFIRQCIKEAEFEKVFSTQDFSLSLSTKSIPIKKGNIQIAARPIPAEIQEHTTQALSKMVKYPEKHSLPSNSSIATTSTKTSSNSERTPNHSYASRASPASHIPNTLPAVERRFQAIEHRLDASVTRMDSIETLCRQLKSNTDIISQQLHQLASDFSTANGVSAQCRSPASKSQRLSGGY